MEIKALVNTQYTSWNNRINKVLVMVESTGKHQVEVLLNGCEQKYSEPTRHDSYDEVNVLVRNASNRAWNRGFSAGRRFASLEDALAGYKNKKIKEMIAAATEIHCVNDDE